MASPRSSNVDSRSSSLGRKRLRQSPGIDCVPASSAEGRANATSRKKQREAKRDVRDFVPPGGLFSSSGASFDEQEANGSGASTSNEPEAKALDGAEEGEVSEAAGLGAHEPQIPTQKSKLGGITPRVNWNTAAGTRKIRTKLGGSGAKVSVPRDIFGISKKTRSPSPEVETTIAEDAPTSSSLRAQQNYGPTAVMEPLPGTSKAFLVDKSDSSSSQRTRNVPSTGLDLNDNAKADVTGQPSEALHRTSKPMLKDFRNDTKTAGDGAEQSDGKDNTGAQTELEQDAVASQNHSGRREFAVVIEKDRLATRRSGNNVSPTQQYIKRDTAAGSNTSAYTPSEKSSMDSTDGKNDVDDSDGDSMIQTYARSDRITRSQNRAMKDVPSNANDDLPRSPDFEPSSPSAGPPQPEFAEQVVMAKSLENSLYYVLYVDSLGTDRNPVLLFVVAIVKPTMSIPPTSALLYLNVKNATRTPIGNLRVPQSKRACGVDTHYGVDCRMRPQNMKLLSGGTTFSYENYLTYYDPNSEHLPISIPMSEQQDQQAYPTHGKRHMSPTFYAASDSDDDPNNFLRPKVNKDSGSRKHIRFGGSGHQSSSANSRQEADRYDTQSRRLPLEEDYRQAPPREAGSQRGSRRAPLPPRPPPPQSPRRDTRYSDYRESNRDRGGDRWQPPLPREPLPPPPPPPARGNKRGRGGGRAARGGGRGGSTDRDTYKPMPSAGKNAWKKHRI
ncbi:MAG: hypothetical protein M4579_002706 [Chaenotheca gracillima]|nr:MAG: hypothetical protein M4579_002706 [Chaenotheca gracillima]